MSIFRRYVEYLKDNPEGYWFKRKLYGWGWTPATREGWLVTIGFIVAVLAFAFTIDENSPPEELWFTFFLPLLLLLTAFLIIAYRKGEPPRWVWGIKDAEEKERQDRSS